MSTTLRIIDKAFGQGPSFKPTMLSLAIAAATSFSLPALAQDAADGASAEEIAKAMSIEEVEVVGFRKSLLTAIDSKRFADSIV